MKTQNQSINKKPPAKNPHSIFAEVKIQTNVKKRPNRIKL